MLGSGRSRRWHRLPAWGRSGTRRERRLEMVEQRVNSQITRDLADGIPDGLDLRQHGAGDVRHVDPRHGRSRECGLVQLARDGDQDALAALVDGLATSRSRWRSSANESDARTRVSRPDVATRRSPRHARGMTGRGVGRKFRGYRRKSRSRLAHPPAKVVKWDRRTDAAPRDLHRALAAALRHGPAIARPQALLRAGSRRMLSERWCLRCPGQSLF